METVVLKKKIYPSRISFCWEGQNLTSDNKGCFRFQQFAYGLTLPIHPRYTALGDQHEQSIQRALIAKDIAHEREVAFHKTINDNTYISGRADFVLEDEVIEAKASFSSNFRTMLKNDDYKINHLAQLGLYMLHFKKKKGGLYCGMYQYGRDKKIFMTYGKKISVVLRDDAFLINDMPTGYTKQNLVDYLIQLTKALHSEQLAPSPVLDDIENYKSPCRYCPLRTICGNASDYQTITNGMRSHAKKLLLSDEIKEPKITKTRNKEFL